jgi:hypothetical protein
MSKPKRTLSWRDGFAANARRPREGVRRIETTRNMLEASCRDLLEERDSFSSTNRLDELVRAKRR